MVPSGILCMPVIPPMFILLVPQPAIIAPQLTAFIGLNVIFTHALWDSYLLGKLGVIRHCCHQVVLFLALAWHFSYLLSFLSQLEVV
jgi:hypothetical protein